MGEILLDTENLFRPFGWTPTREDAATRAHQLSQYDEDLRLTSVDDVEAVARLAHTAVAALVAWSHDWLRDHHGTLGSSLSYGKRDPGVTVALGPLRAAGYRHVTVGWGKDKAEDALVARVTQARWSAAPYVFGCGDKKLIGAVELHVSQVSEHRAVLVLPADVYDSARKPWFGEPNPRYPTLKEYGEGHVALHLLTREWMRRQSAAGRLRAAPAREPASVDRSPAPTAAAAAAHWRERWFRRKFPKASPSVPLSSETWVQACCRGRIPPPVSRRLRGELEVLYAGAFETGEGPVTWTLACRAAIMLDTVRADLGGPPEGLSEIEEAAFAEARVRLLSRRTDRSDG